MHLNFQNARMNDKNSQLLAPKMESLSRGRSNEALRSPGELVCQHRFMLTLAVWKTADVC
jgi:hypothetical protein